MSFSINAGTLFVGAFLFIIGVFLKPAIMVLRDKMVWWWIESKLLNDELEDDLRKFKFETQLFTERVFFGTDFTYEPNEEKPQIWSKDKNVRLTNEEFRDIESECVEMMHWYKQTRINFAKKSHLLDLLLKHYSQDKPNLIDKRLEEIEKYKEENPMDDGRATRIIIKSSRVMRKQ